MFRNHQRSPRYSRSYNMFDHGVDNLHAMCGETRGSVPKGDITAHDLPDRPYMEVSYAALLPEAAEQLSRELTERARS